ncbi:hypothetical protein C3K47_05935 [Solitalea longa]|uniref:DUF2383 domain-containing protein n=1 Tax=Solitalea longa TaxID=2079460 RepID=A0A2S5A5C4_9SPHI|nr:PA2169 family four-helix-bundle protein [Solitalea longa]POY37303.1 hypothetical protein C3K47_05935 [Solitalea longa]
METANKTTIVSALNDLVKTNNDRYMGYQKALSITHNESLKPIFQKLAMDSSKNINELSDLILQINGKPIEDSSVAGKFYRAWMDVKAMFTGNDDHTLLSDCEYGEDMALKAYDSVDDSNDLSMSDPASMLLDNQRSRIKDGHETIKSLRDNSKAF